MKDLISVIVPVYNVESYLNRCIESLVRQTYKYLEIILVDDGSLDGCPHICDKWSERDNRIHVIHKTNGGLSSARNAGLKVAKGEYIAFLDSDDWIHTKFIEHLYITIKDYKVDIAACDICQVYSSCVPTLVLGYSVKSRGIARDLFGNEENYVLPVQSLQEPDELTKHFRWLVGHEKEIKDHLEKIMPEYISKAYSGKMALDKLVR